MESTFFPMLRDGIIKFFSDLKFFFKKDFIKQNYYKHFVYSLMLTVFCIWFMLNYMHLADTPNWFHIFIGGLGARIVNFAREWYYGIKVKALLSWEDINFGTYGGILAAIILDYFKF